MYSASQSDFVPLDATVNAPKYDVSSPRCVVALNGTNYIPVRSSITMNGHGATDEATITLPLSSNPDFTAALFQDDPNLNYPVYAEIYSGFPNDAVSGSTSIAQLSRRFLGIVDSYSAQFTSDDVTFTCRSLAAPLVDNKLTKSPPNGMTSVQFVQYAAAMLGLKTNIVLNEAVEPMTIQEAFAQELIGGQSFAATLTNKTYWEIMLATAQFDDADVWVSLDTLNYCSPQLIKRANVPLKYGRDLVDPHGTHSPQFARDIQVEVRTYKKKTRTSTTARVVSNPATGGTTITSVTKTVTSQPIFGTAQTVSTSTSPTGVQSTTVSSTQGGAASSGFTTPGSESGKQRYIKYVPNLTPARANMLAQALWRQYSMREYALDFTVPVTEDLFAVFDITALLNVTGLPYSFFNDTYWPRRIQEDFDPSSDGFSWKVEAVNHVLPQGAV